MLYLLALSLLLSSSIHGDRLIFSQDHDDLSLITRQDLLENVLQTDGALAVTNLGVNCARALQSLKKNAPSCLGELENSIRIKFQDCNNVRLSIKLLDHPEILLYLQTDTGVHLVCTQLYVNMSLCFRKFPLI